ncbi:MAG: Gfo/Idh/MocA family oxidoreductase [Bacteroides sp.]|nr:Gfo/Idh/MocA family oxidoreductase [Eubacterium sp.]MCM1417974.1 Gfo/Idh/MocA family oxidoreductase [Roseburia sp.]MCM1461779.1 Gfo/Idh/MocA family oxidoreductase [Bacteroides sp.]
MKVLMIGLGSIGQRHLRNIRRLYGESAEIIAYRVRKLKTAFSDSMQIRENIDLEKEYHISAYTDLSEALAQKPNVAFICNVTSAHISCALEVAKRGCHLFLEKPISDSMDGVEELKRISEEKKIKVFVGFQNRYHPALLKAKEYIKSGRIGKIISAHAEVGERLATMHSYEDYRTTYMARSELGGGVILNQMIHEIDYLRYIFGEPDSIFAFGNEESENLGIDVDDCCDAMLNFQGIPISMHADFYQFPPERYLLVVGSLGKIKADLIKNRITLWEGDRITETDFDSFSRNDMFVEELRLFMECIEKDGKPDITLHDGIAALEIALAAKRSIIDHEVVFDLNKQLL